MKKFLLLMLGALLALPALAVDFTYGYEGQTLTYTITDDYYKYCMIKAGSSSAAGNNVSGKLIIPSTVKNEGVEYTVKGIGNYAFFGCTGLTSVSIPESVNSIGISAFKGCSGLTKAEFASIEALCKTSFSTNNANPLYYTHNLYIGGKEVTELVIPQTVTSISGNAFYGCTGLTSVSIPESVTLIANCAFQGCTGLTSITIPESVTTIGVSVFYECTGLKELIYNAENCADFTNSSPFPSTLESVTIGNKVKTIPRYAFQGCSGLTSITIPESVTSIGTYAFQDCSGLTSITIPESVTSIGNYTFKQCSGLTSITIPESVTSISSSAFQGCSGLKELIYNAENCKDFTNSSPFPSTLESVTIGNTVKTIPSYAFYNCSVLTSLSISESVTSIGYNAFKGCTDLKDIYVFWKSSIPFYDPLFSSSTYETATLHVPENSIAAYILTPDWSNFAHISDGTSTITIKDFTVDGLNYRLINNENNREAILVSGDYSALTDVIIPDRITDESDPSNPVIYYITGIAAKTFYNCTKLKTVSISSRSKIKQIGDYAFYNCYFLTSINIPSTVTYIGNYTFYDCNNLISMEIPSAVTYIGNYAFGGCEHLTGSINIPASTTYLGESAFYGCKAITSATIDAEISNIPAYLFYECQALKSVNIPGTVEEIGDYAFYSCSSLTDVTIPNSVTTIGEWAFFSCDSFKELIIPNSVVSLGKAAFIACMGLTSLQLPDNITAIPQDAFFHCVNLKELNIPASVTTIGQHAFGTSSNFEWAGFTSLTIPSTVEKLSNHAFDGCNLAELKIEDGTSILNIGDDNSGNWCSSEGSVYVGRPFIGTIPCGKSLTLGNLVTEISPLAFCNSKNLTDLSLGNSITSIGGEAFSGCTALTEVVMPGSVETIGAQAFSGATSLSTIIMGSNVKTIGMYAFNGCPAENVYITAQTPPTADANTFSSYTGNLYLQGQATADAYYDSTPCWYKFTNNKTMIEPTGIKYDGAKSLTGIPGDTYQLATPSLIPENVTLPHLFWRSTNPEIATVDQNGLVTIIASPSEIMLMAEDDEIEGRTCQIIAESLYANGPRLEIDVTDESTGIGSIIMDKTPAGEIDYSAPYEIYNLNGQKLGSEIGAVAPGIYIVRQGATTVKRAVR